jgi:gluconate 5-dehydrogenase
LADCVSGLFSLPGKIALVTGGSGDIGRVLALGLASAGATVAINGTNPGLLADVRAELVAVGGLAESFAADLADVAECERLVARVIERFGRVDVLVNCAGINRRQPILEVTPDDYERVMAVDLRAAYFVSQAAARVMIECGGGSIVHVGSINSAIGLATISVYAAAKAGLSQLTRNQAVEWAAHGIRVNCLAPGFIVTKLTEGPLFGDERKRRWMLDRIPLGRGGTPDELVGPLLLLASDAGSYLTGQTLYVEGGILSGSTW